MALKDTLPVSYLLFTTRGRINRRTYWTVSIFIWSSYYLLYTLLEKFTDWGSIWILNAIFFWTCTATAAKRLHDANHRGLSLLWLLVPVLGPILVGYRLGFQKGNADRNRFGAAPGTVSDYFVNPGATGTESSGWVVDDVTQLNPVVVRKVVRPETVEELISIVREAKGKVSVGGGRFSMGGQTASPGCMHVDMRGLNRVLEFDPENRTIRVEAGIRWCDIQKKTDPYGLGLKIMQTYANFTVGGSLSVNCHGRYIGLGPLILSVRELEIVLADGSLKRASPTQEPELFFGAVGCYNALGIIVNVTLELAENRLVEQVQQKMKRGQYASFFAREVRDNLDVVFHNGDIYPPLYRNVRAVSWVHTTRKPTTPTALMTLAAAYPLERYFIRAFSRSRFGKWRREYIIDPLLYLKRRVHWRNYEAGYDVAELEPRSRKKSTYVLQEYFAPVAQFDEFAEKMAQIFMRHDVNVLNVSIRHALPDPGSLLAWAPQEVFAFVVWYKQGTSALDRHKVAIWTRELIDAALSVGGAYYLPYQPHATPEQFHRAYPNAGHLFSLKRKYDPEFKFSNVLWDRYYTPTLSGNL